MLSEANNDFTEEQMYILDTLGLIIYRKLIPKGKIDYIANVINGFLGNKNPKPLKYSFIELDPVFVELMSHPWFVNVCKHTLGPQFRLDHAMGVHQPGSIKCGKTGRMVQQDHNHGNIHGGVHSGQGSSYYLGYSLDHIFIGQITIGISITGQSIETGGFCYIPGSHKQSEFRGGSSIFKDTLKSKYNNDCIKVLNLEPGDVIVFPENLMHGTTPLTKSCIRQALYYRYCPGFCCWRDYNEIKHYHALAKTEVQKNMLRPPYVGSIPEEDGVMLDNVYKKPTV